MNKTSKGAIAAGAAAVLLLGGAGSLAFWSDTDVLEGGAITSGSLDITNPTCDADWTYKTAFGNPAGAVGQKVVTVVPGDTITKTCKFDVVATGDNLKATLNTPAVTFRSNAVAPKAPLTLTPTATYTLAGASLANGDNRITSLDNGKTVTAVINVDIPYGTSTVNGNATQLTTSTLNTITVLATQVDPSKTN